MIKKIKDWFSKRGKDSQYDTPPIKDAVAYCTLVLTAEDALIISADCKDGHDEAMAKMVFLLSSGVLMETINNLICQKYEDNTAMRDAVLQQAYVMMMQNVGEEEEYDEDEDEEDPVVDPCCVFRQAKNGVEDNDINQA